MDICVYDSRQSYFKAPFGAVESGKEVTFRINLPKNKSTESVQLILTCEQSTSVQELSQQQSAQQEEGQGGQQAQEQHIPMKLSHVGKICNVYTCSISPKTPGLYFYYFSFTEMGVYNVIKGDNKRRGILDNDFGICWQMTVYDSKMKTPGCFGKGIMYQIFPDRFCNSQTPKEDIPTGRWIHPNWGTLPDYLPDAEGEITNSDYFGGDLKGIEEKIPYLKNLGVSCIYMNPIFEAHSNHRYNTADYNKIDPLLGNEEDFKNLCSTAKKEGISVVLDGVFSHTGSDSIYFNEAGRYGERQGAYRDPQSAYRSWYNFQNYPKQYECWWGFKTLPNVSETNPDYMDFICNEQTGIVQKWLKLGASGFRLDVVDELPDAFIDRLCVAVKSCGEDNCLIGEVWEDASNKVSYSLRRRYLQGGQLDSVMNYPFRNAILAYIRNGAAEEFLATVAVIVENYPLPVLSCVMNSISTHDTPRAITALVGPPMEGKQRPWQADHHYLSTEEYQKGLVLLKLASTLQYFLPGIPCLYYGDEAGLSGYADPFNRCCYPWGFENKELVDWFCELGQLRLSFDFLSQSDFSPVTVNQSLCTYLRCEGKKQVLVAVNRGEHDCVLPIPENFSDDETKTETYILCGGFSNGTISAKSAVVIAVQ